MEGEDGSPQREDVAMDGGTGEGQIIKIHKVPLVRLDHADVKVEAIPPEFVFPEPPKPEAWRLEPPTTAAVAAPTAGAILVRLPYAALAGGALLVAAAKWLGHCSRSRHSSFSRRVLQLSAATERTLAEERSSGGARRRGSSSGGSSNVRSLSSSSCGSLGDRVNEAERQLATLQELIADGVDIDRRFPWHAARREGQESRRLRACARDLSRRLAKVEQATEELRVMAEVERLLARLGGGGGGVLHGDGLPTGGEGEWALEDQSDSDADESDIGARGASGSAAQERRRRKRPARLSTRAAVLLSRRSSGGSDGSDSGDNGGTRYVPGCVFREELEAWCQRLSEKEQEAVDWLKLGLQCWNLEKVDGALAQLRVLELPDNVKDFQKRREDVRSKRWRLEKELKAAIDQPGEGHSRLQKACVKAETFYATDLDEYQSARRALENARAVKLEEKAQRILSANGFTPDLHCNVRLDLRGTPKLLLRDGPVDAGLVGGGGGASTGLLIGASARNSPVAGRGVGRRLVLHSEGEDAEPHLARDAAARGVASGSLMTGNGAHNCGSPLAQDGGAVGDCGVSKHRATTATRVAGVDVSGSLAVAPFGQSSARGGAEGGGMQVVHQMMAARPSAEMDAKKEFDAFVTKQEEEHKETYGRFQTALEDREAEDVHRQECIARLDARNEQEQERLAMEESRLLAEERRRERDEEERKRRADADRLNRLWSSDGDFLWLLSAADVALAAATVAFKKGFSLAPGAVFNAAWGLVVAECVEGAGGDGVGASGAGASGAARPLCASSTAVGAASASGFVSGLGEGSAGYDGVCGGAGGVWKEVAAGGGGGDGGAGEGSESTLSWAWSAAGSTAGAVVRAGYASAGWLLGQTLGLVTPDVQCEIRVVLSLGAWLLSLVLVMKIVGGLLGRGNGGGVAAQWVLLAAWVWGRFHDWVMHASQELVLFFAPAPSLVFAYCRALRYFEQRRKPDGFWWVNGWDVRFLWSRALPAVVSGFLACLLGAQVS